MAIEFRCTNCNKLLRTKDDTAGKQAKCPECGTILQIPAPGHVPPPPPGEFAPPPPATNYGTGQEYGGAPSPAESSNPFAAPQFGGPMAAAPDSSGRTGPPWERDGQNVNSYIETVKVMLSNPSFAYADMRREGGFGKPLLFAIIGSFIAIIAANIYNLLFSGLLGGLGGRFGNAELGGLFAGGMIGMVCSIIVVPAMVAAAMFIGSGIQHLMLMLVGGARYGFETTLRVVAYAAGATAPIQLIPFVGGLIAVIAQLVLIVIGYTKAHEISTGKAVLAVLLPTLICCVAGILLWGAIIAVFVTSAQRGAPF
jgi:phage FluMu protein Com